MSTDDTSPTKIVLPGRRAAKVALANFAEQLGSSSDTEGNTWPLTKGSVKIKYGGKGKQQGPKVERTSRHPITPRKSLPVPIPPLTPTTRPHPRPISAGKKRQLTPPGPSNSDGDESDLTPLSSANGSPNTDSKIQARPMISMRPFPHTPAPRPSSSIGTSQRQNLKGEDSWDVTTLGTYIWVLVDKRARVFDPDDEDDQAAPKERIWWPGKITSPRPTDIPLSIKTFGMITPDIGGSLEINSPSHQNILPMTSSLGKMRFESPAYVTSPPSPTRNAEDSPRKKQKRDNKAIEARWNKAVSEMVKEKEDDDDGLPDIGLAFSMHASTPVSANMKAGAAKGTGQRSRKPSSSKRKGKGRSEDELEWESAEELDMEVEDDHWIPPMEDENLNIPGELVLAHGGSGIYWPAKVMEYIPPKKRNQRHGKYRIKYLDETEKIMTREWFYSADETQFVTCKLGEFESEAVDVENDRDEDQQDPDYESSPGSNRVSSPVPSYPPPSPKSFASLSIHQQLAYAKPVLQAILNGNYEPAKKRHDAFIRGGRWRKDVASDGGSRGAMELGDVAALQKCLSEWSLRGERFAKKMVDDGEGDGGNAVVEADAITHMTPGSLEKDERKPENELSADNLSALQRRASSPAATEDVPFSSQCDGPPSSYLGASNMDIPMEAEAEQSLSKLSPLSTLSEENLTISVLDPSGENIPDLPVPPPSEQDPPTKNEADDPGPNTTEHKDVDQPQAEEVWAAPARQYGCEAYEALSPLEKVDYCVNVLLPEAIIQLLLWRSGERTSVELLSPEEEQALYKLGQEKREERDWVFDVMRLRESKARRLAKIAGENGGQETGGDMALGGTRSRPARKGRSW